jgi:hypothetical protein
MKTLKVLLLVTIVTISSTADATGSKRVPPQPTLIEEIIEIFTGTTK